MSDTGHGATWAQQWIADEIRKQPEMTDPQEGVRRGMWMTHDGLIPIRDMPDEHVLNAYKTCLRHGNDKAEELWLEMEWRDIEWRVK